MKHSKYHYVNVLEENETILELVSYLYILFLKVRLNNKKIYIKIYRNDFKI